MTPRHRSFGAIGLFVALLAGSSACARSKDTQQRSASAPPASQPAKLAPKDYQKPPADQLKARLTPIQYEVTQQNGTEPPFRNEFWNNKHDGLYVDIVSGEPLFSSRDKFASGTGWPSFTQPVEPERVVSIQDDSYGMTRVEVRSKSGDAHLGHVFDDGPAPTGLRYCINSASLRFIPVEKLEQEGYGVYLSLFK